MRAVDKLTGILTSRVDGRIPAVCRTMVGAAAVLEIASKGPVVVSFFTSPEFVPARNFAWLPDLSPSSAIVLVVIGLVAGVCFSAGFLTRSSGVVVVCAIGYPMVLDQNLYSNHGYLLVLVAGLLVLADAGAAFSIDRRLGWKRASDVPNWPLTLIRIQISLVYLSASLAKLNPVFLSGDVLRSSSLLPAILGGGEALVLAAWAVVLWELFQSGALWIPELRAAAFLSGLVFHVSIVLVMGRFPSAGLIVFGMVSVSCYLLFLDGHTEAKGTICNGGDRGLSRPEP